MGARERLELIGVKVERAKEHLRALDAEVHSFLASMPYVIETRRDPDSRRLIYFIVSVRPIPLRISAILGDTIHNLRSALDHLAYQLVWVGIGKAPSSRVCFPIADDRLKYVEQRRRQLRGAPYKAIMAVDALTPYKGGNDTFWKLRTLSDVDRHRVLITAGCAFRSVKHGAVMFEETRKMSASGPLASGLSGLPSPDALSVSADRLFPMEQGHELFVDRPDAVLDEKLQFRFEVAFGEQGVLFGEPIIETLGSMASLVEGLLPIFEPYLA